MRITRDTLLRVAKETAIKRSLSEPGLVAAYLTGSLLSDDPFLGKTTDIDLVYIHATEPGVRREIVPLIPDVHLDIVHACEKEYANPKELRTHPTLGPELYDPIWLYETRHFLEFVQAAVRTKYQDPANIIGRSRRNIQAARQGWLEIQSSGRDGAAGVKDFLNVIEAAANALAVLNGRPLAERRFLVDFPARCVAAGHAEFAGRVSALIGGADLDPACLAEFMPAWEKDFENACGRENVDVSIAVPRQNYYRAGIQELFSSEMPQAALWTLLHTWTLAAMSLPAGLQGRYQSFCEQLGLHGLSFLDRVQELDTFLDEIEELLESMAAAQGV